MEPKDPGECALKEITEEEAFSLIQKGPCDRETTPDHQMDYIFNDFTIMKRKIGKKTVYLQHFVKRKDSHEYCRFNEKDA